jgi:hypothetical protein
MTTQSSASDASLFRYSPIALFLAGALSVLLFQQGALAILHAAGFVPSPPFSYGKTQPFGVPQIWSFAFWGGVWGLVYGVAEKHFPDNAGYWIMAILFGLLPTLVLWFIVFPLRGVPMAAGWEPTRMAVHVVIHCAWSLGTGILLRLPRTSAY